MVINKSTDFSKIKQPDWVWQGIFWSKMYSLRQEQNMTAHQSFISLSRFIQNPTLQIPASPLSSQITRTGTNRRLFKEDALPILPKDAKQRYSSFNTHSVRGHKRVIHTSGLRLNAFTGFPTQRKSKMISFIAKSKHSYSKKMEE